MKCISF